MTDVDDLPGTGGMTDAGEIRVNMTEEEARSTDRGGPLPRGTFHYKITDMEIMHVRETRNDGSRNKNAGKAYINFEFTVQDGQYEGRKDWVNAMCFEGALYTISQILKALGQDVSPDRAFAIPTAREFYIGKDLWGRRGQSRQQKDQFPDDPDRWIQLQGFSKYTGGTSQVQSGSGTPAATGTKKASVLP